MDFVGAFRKSELVSLTIDDTKFVREGLQITLKKSKNDQEGKGESPCYSLWIKYSHLPCQGLK
ncbi:hypothetical protein PRO82_000379 [Candidatus Protochlamydia amoebophila]|uniref:hypothetical protein n=1 Tax=Candidatus Protochlamydia amoebophila TaxID=362787 RepID=UPI001BC8F49D|nr:hypothetical protein [Candidatus Protochlamydia amoebophila]MBS4163083.1 hypothetical protein [Candidatus Protochlamydia amoebophila]